MCAENGVIVNVKLFFINTTVHNYKTSLNSNGHLKMHNTARKQKAELWKGLALDPTNETLSQLMGPSITVFFYLGALFLAAWSGFEVLRF